MKETWKRVRPVVFAAWIVAAIRLALEFTVKPEVGDLTFHVSVYYVVGLALVIVGISGAWGWISFKSLLASTLMIAVLAFFVPGAIAYTTGQIQGWTHGRFRPPEAGKTGWGEDEKARAAPLADTAGGKIGAGLMVSAGTTLGGFIWSTVFGFIFVWIPGRQRKRP